VRGTRRVGKGVKCQARKSRGKEGLAKSWESKRLVGGRARSNMPFARMEVTTKRAYLEYGAGIVTSGTKDTMA